MTMTGFMTHTSERFHGNGLLGGLAALREKKTNRRKAQQNELESTESELSDCEQITVQEDSEETDNEEDCSLEQKRRRKSRKPGHA
mmetsp:Transcript_12355/g.27898  ORF Transcript_12355/g.27898 Transcript_12355/m.27898 type:complete len:86 (+) Transcript_12355:153-410(+)